MELHFRVLDADKLIQVDAEGKVDLRRSVQIARQIAEFDATAGHLPVLLDARKLLGRLSILDIVELVKAMVADAGRYKSRLALLVRPGDQLERARFLENYSRNRGIPIAAFTDYEQAVSWLASPES